MCVVPCRAREGQVQRLTVERFQRRAIPSDTICCCLWFADSLVRDRWLCSLPPLSSARVFTLQTPLLRESIRRVYVPARLLGSASLTPPYTPLHSIRCQFIPATCV